MQTSWAPLSPGSRYFVATEMFIEGLFDVIVMLVIEVGVVDIGEGGGE